MTDNPMIVPLRNVKLTLLMEPYSTNGPGDILYLRAEVGGMHGLHLECEVDRSEAERHVHSADYDPYTDDICKQLIKVEIK